MKPRKSFLLRIPPELYTELEAWAAQEMRSVNGQIEYLLHDAAVRRRGDRQRQANRKETNATREGEAPAEP
jgi:hypothetical protein